MNPLGLGKNKTTVFILPMAFEDKKHSDILTDDFVNAYIADFDEPIFDDRLTLVYKDEIERYEIPDKFLGDYFKIIAGAYNDVSEEYKQHLLSFWECDVKSRLYEVIYGKDKIAKQLIPPFELTEEIYNIGVPI